jgi:hypothetical protein
MIDRLLSKDLQCRRRRLSESGAIIARGYYMMEGLRDEGGKGREDDVEEKKKRKKKGGFQAGCL